MQKVRNLLNLISKNPKTCAVLFGVFLSVFIFFCLEIFFGLLNSYENRPEDIPVIRHCYDRDKNATLKDESIGYKYKPNSRCYGTKVIKGMTIYNYECSFDQYGRRVVPTQYHKQPGKFIVFFGCSVAFGQGGNDNETMPYYVSKLAKDYRSYNYGVEGYGTAQMLVKFQTGNLKDEIKEKSGILIYTYIDPHVHRVAGSSSITTQWGKNFPNFKLVGNKLERKGNFTTHRPFLSFIYQLFVKSQIVKYFKLELPWIRENHIELTAKIIEESRNLFKEQFNSDDFYVVLYPLGSSLYGRRLIKYLELANIKYLDYSNLIYGNSYYKSLPYTTFAFEGDWHPTPMLHKIVAEKIVKDLSLN